jgi:flavin reductase (DIM6/NTAB) family NADH-FMN oxidoreductase RutF
MEINENIIETLGKITYGLYVLTTKKGEEINGMIASWVSQVSFSPPLVMVGVRKNRYSHKMIDETGIFALNVLAKEDINLVSRFKGPDPKEKFKGLKWKTKATGAPILEETLAYMDCKLTDSVNTGDHTIFIGQIIKADILKEGVPVTSLDYGKVYLGQS